ncbi:MAG: S-adenosylmethionine decarboxylase [Armatimonadota bacterium]
MQHFMLDGFRGFRSRFDDIRLVQEILEEAPCALSLEPAMPAFLLPYYNGVDPDDCGISAFLFLRGGHFTLHTFSFREVYFVDLVANDPYDVRKFHHLLDAAFPCATTTVHTVQRAQPYPRFAVADTNIDFGPHILLDIDDYTGPTTMDELFTLFDRLPGEIKMTPIMRPYVLKGTTVDGQRFISAMMMIAESHISLHIFPDSRQARLDLFSCRFFDPTPVAAQILTELPGRVTNNILIGRGSKYRMMRNEHSYEAARTKRWLQALPTANFT